MSTRNLNVVYAQMGEEIFLGYRARCGQFARRNLWTAVAIWHTPPEEIVSSTQAKAMVLAAEAESGLRPPIGWEKASLRMHLP